MAMQPLGRLVGWGGVAKRTATDPQPRTHAPLPAPCTWMPKLRQLCRPSCIAQLNSTPVPNNLLHLNPALD
jgi:hypothetical protein